MKSFHEYIFNEGVGLSGRLGTWDSPESNEWGELVGPFEITYPKPLTSKASPVSVLDGGKVKLYFPSFLLPLRSMQMLHDGLMFLISRKEEGKRSVQVMVRRVLLGKRDSMKSEKSPRYELTPQAVRDGLREDERWGTRSFAIATVDGMPLGDVAGVREPNWDTVGTKGEPKEWFPPLQRRVNRLVQVGDLKTPEMRTSRDMFGGYYVFESPNQPDAVIMWSPRGVSIGQHGAEQAIYILKKKIKLIEPDKDWKIGQLEDYEVAIRRFSRRPLWYLKAFLSKDGPFPLLADPKTRGDAPPEQKAFYNDRLESLFSDVVSSPNEVKRRLLFRFYLQGLSMAGETYGNEFDRDMEGLTRLIRAFAKGTPVL